MRRRKAVRRGENEVDDVVNDASGWPAILLRGDAHLSQLASGLHSQVEAQQ